MYTLTGQKCGTVRFRSDAGIITKESLTRSSTITDNPVEGGSNINDHVFRNAQQFTLTGVAVSQSAYGKLEQMWQQGDILTYMGTVHIDMLVIQNLSQNFDASNANGFGFTITLKKIQIVSSQQASTSSMMSSQDAGKAQESTTSGSSQTAATSADGLKTTVTETISSSAYMDYVNSYASKPQPSAGPSSRTTPSYNGLQT